MIIFIYSDGYRQEFPYKGKHTMFKGIKHNNERPIEVLLPEEIKEYPEIVNQIRYCLHPLKDKITYV